MSLRITKEETCYGWEGFFSVIGSVFVPLTLVPYAYYLLYTVNYRIALAVFVLQAVSFLGSKNHG